MTKLRWFIVKAWLQSMQSWAEGRIRSGDLDFDDVVYDTRDAATTLLRIWFEKGQNT